VLAGEIFEKTSKGRSEMEINSKALSMRERRVLILVNGERSASLIKEQSMFNNIIEILERLEQQGYIGRNAPVSHPTEQISAAAGTSY
jgi:hypothetical protein